MEKERKMGLDERVKCFNQVQKLRDFIETSHFVLSEEADDAVKAYLEAMWTEAQSLLEYLE